MPRVVIVGAGFGGLAAARALADAPVDVVVVDRNNFHTFQPLLYQVATAGLEPEDIAYSVRGILRRQRNASFRMAEAVGDPRAIDDGALTFAIVGGGPTGVELSGALSELVGHVLAKDFPRLDVLRTRIVLIEATGQVLGAFHPESQRHARETLEARGVEVMLHAAVEDRKSVV